MENKQIMPEIPKAYNPQEIEDRIYKKWEESGYFNPDNLKLSESAKKFVISMPPPNATGVLHLGHASMLAYEDLMIRYNRLKGKRTLWLPGTDHAAIATQTKVEKIIAKEGKTKYDLGREEFLKRIREYVENSRSVIKNQTRKIGSSCDWSRERYTLDKGLSRAVKEVFVKMYNDGLIYRGNRIVNWCPRCESTLADDEVEYREQKAKLYYFRYSKDFPIAIASTRPETKLGDTAVAVNPKDERYKKYIGKIYKVNFGNGEREIKIIADRGVDMEFGAGALGVTPAHSMADWKIAQENNLPVIKVIGEDGKMTQESGKEYERLTVLEARERFVKYLKNNNLIEKVEEIDQNLTVCYRCETPIEPLPSLQWFVNVSSKFKVQSSKFKGIKKGREISLKDLARTVVENGQIEIIPKRFEKIYFHWMENLHDWCISRQIWFGHRIPVWYKSQIPNTKYQINSKFKIQNSKINSQFTIHNSKFKNEIYVGVESPEGEGWIQDSDTLDTWFSSGLWTFSTLLDQDHKKYKTFEEWIANSPDLKKFHPTSVMETGYDLIFFWVARMILMTTYALGEIPFEKVYFHGMVRDKLGRKMSKSLGNGVDPVEMIDKYGTDALRLSMIIGSSPGNDIKLYEEKIEGYRNFVNKLWNISRYVIGSSKFPCLTAGKKVQSSKLQFKIQSFKFKKENLTLYDKWILGKLNDLIKEVTDNLDDYKFSQAGEKLRDFTWGDFADWYIEISKVKKDKDEILLYILEKLLILWHPFAPFVTEEIWKNFIILSKEGDIPECRLLMTQKWPKELDKSLFDKETEQNFKLIQDIIMSIRTLRAENKIEPSQKIKAIIASRNKAGLAISQSEIIKSLARLKELEICEEFSKKENAIFKTAFGFSVYIFPETVVDKSKSRASLQKEIESVEKYIRNLQSKLENNDFVANAPLLIVEKEREKYKKAENKLRKLKEEIESLESRK